MNYEDLRLIRPTPALSQDFLAFAKEHRAKGEHRYDAALDDLDAYCRLLEDHAAGRNLPAGYVPTTTFWLITAGQTVLAESRLRHTLTPALEDWGGHIGYNIRPSQRRKGYGTRLLALTLLEARAIGLTRALVTCNVDNVASARVIENNGGQLWTRSPSSRAGATVSRYWIDLPEPSDPPGRAPS
jgi:predicted acetyltransferase